MDDDESTKVSYGTDREPAAEGRCRRRLSWTERRPQGANWAGNRIVVGGGRKTAGHFISGAGYRSQWPRYATGDLGPMRGKHFCLLAGKLLKRTATMPHVKRSRNASVSYPPLPGGLSNCRGARSHEHLDSLTRVAGRLTRVLGDEGDDANRNIYKWPVRLHGSGGAHTSSNGGKTLLDRAC